MEDGGSPQAVNKPGRVAIARITRQAGEHVMLITSGYCMDVTHEKLQETHWGFSLHAFVKLDADPCTLAQELRSNHLSLVYGDFVRIWWKPAGYRVSGLSWCNKYWSR